MYLQSEKRPEETNNEAQGNSEEKKKNKETKYSQIFD